MKLLRWADCSESARREALARPVAEHSRELMVGVESIIADVKLRGDIALRELTERHDRVRLEQPWVTSTEFTQAREAIDSSMTADLEEAIRRVSLFHRAQLPAPIDLETSAGVRCERRFLPIARVGLYVPGGTAPLPSTAIMLGVPAAIAGCKLRVLATPPRRDGSIDPHILVAAQILGIEKVLKAGGAQAIAALAYGTANIPKVDKIFGPGNSWVTEAKLQVSRDPGGAACDLPAGPSEVLVIGDASANPAFVASDLLSQAEHGEDSQVVLVSDSRKLLEAVEIEVARQLELLPRREIARRALSKSVRIEVGSLDEAMELSNLYAPEHLILEVADARRYAEGVRNAGSVFIGQWTPESAGDYASGTNHVLPTYGFARAFGGLTTESFLKSVTFQEITPEGLKDLGPVVARLAQAEQLEAHANAVQIRLAEIDLGDVSS